MTSSNFRIKLMEKLAKTSLHFFVTNYNNEGHNKSSFVKWKKKQKPNGQKQMIHTGKLFSTLKIKSVSPRLIVLSANTPYAKILNEGIGITARPFLYKSRSLTLELEKTIINDYTEEIVKSVKSVFKKYSMR